MKFSTKEDIEAPIDAVFDMLCDFEMFERAAMRRGAEVQRTDSKSVPGTGMGWQAAFNLRGKRRQVTIDLIAFERPNEMAFECRSLTLTIFMTMELVALSRSRTRILMATDIKPQNLSARLLVQSLKLAKTSLTKKYKLRMAEFVRGLEDRHKRAA